MKPEISEQLRKAHESKIKHITERLNELRIISHTSQSYEELKDVARRAKNLYKVCNAAITATTSHKHGCSDELGNCREEYYKLLFKFLTREAYANRRSQEILANSLR